MRSRLASARRPGRPSALTPETEARILNAIRCGTPKKNACAAAGISEATLYSWLRQAKEMPRSQYAEFAAKLDRALDEGITAKLAVIMKAGQKDWRAMAWLLERQLPEVFSTKFKLEHTTREPTFREALASLREDRKPKLLKEAGS